MLRLTVQGSIYKKFRQAGQSIRAFIKDSKYENFPFWLAVTFPIHEFDTTTSKRLLKELYHIFDLRIHEIPFSNHPRLHMLGETRMSIIQHTHHLNERYREKYTLKPKAHQIESYDTSRPYFIASEILQSTFFDVVTHQYMKWGNLHQPYFQPNLLFYLTPRHIPVCKTQAQSQTSTRIVT